MPVQARKMSEMLQQMTQQVLRADPPTVEAACAALLFAHIAWNESVGIGPCRNGFGGLLQDFQRENPRLWVELKSRDSDALIDELIEYKQTHFPGDRRRILNCGIVDGKIRVEWLPPVEPGTDANREMAVFGLTQLGDVDGALRILRKDRRMSPIEAAAKVAAIQAELARVRSTLPAALPRKRGRRG